MKKEEKSYPPYWEEVGKQTQELTFMQCPLSLRVKGVEENIILSSPSSPPSSTR